MAKTGIKLVMGVLALAALWLGVSFWAGSVVDSELKAFADRSTKTSVRVIQLDHRKGGFSSTGTMKLRIVNRCDRFSKPDDGIALSFDYSLSNLIFPNSLMRFDWGLRPEGGAAAASFKEVFGTTATLKGSGKVSLDKAVSSTLELPQVNWNSNGQTVQASPSHGVIKVGEKDLGINWITESVLIRGKGDALELQKIAVDVAITNRARGIGKSTFSVSRIAASAGSLDELRIAAEVSEHGDKIDSVFTNTIKGISFAGQSGSDFAFEIAIRDLHAASLETIGTLISDACNVDALAVDERNKLQAALRKITADGFSLGIPRIAGAIGKGHLGGDFVIQLLQAKAGSSALENRVKSTGQLKLSGDVLTQEQRKLVLSMGFATQTPEGLVAKFEYETGLIRANGRVFDGEDVVKMLRFLDRQVAALLSEQVSNGAPPSPKETPLTTETAAEPAANNTPVGPSFDCAKASMNSEKLICSDRELSALDVRLANTYARIRNAASDKNALQKSQFDWIKNHQRICRDKACMVEAYHQRLRQLEE